MKDNISQLFPDPFENLNLPDMSELAAFIKKHGYKKAMTLTMKAEQLLDPAYDATSIGEQIEYVKQALAISPLCSDAYLICTDLPDLSSVEILLCYQLAANASRLVIEPSMEEYKGHFWGIMETRPYMRAHFGLAQQLWEMGDHEPALMLYEHLLGLNPNDNQGVRYVLLECYLADDNFEMAELLLKDYKDDASCVMAYTRALIAHKNGKRNKNTLLKKALENNPHVPRFFDGTLHVDLHSENDYYTIGGIDEASIYVNHHYLFWLGCPGAIQWIIKETK